jgi:glycosyltransferase involved in cell wall biosynthesis
MISVIVPVFNEEKIIAEFLADLTKNMSGFKEFEIIVVNDGSTDNTKSVLNSIKMPNLKIIDHVENVGYGKSLLDGISEAKYECISIIDGDGSYPANQIAELYKFYPSYDMVVGARQGKEYKKGIFKRPARILFDLIVSYSIGHKIPDVNSGLRIFNKQRILKYKSILCTGFSFTTTMTLIYFLNHYFVKYVPVVYLKRLGKSKVNHYKDTLRTGQIIVQTVAMFNPVKLFMLLGFFDALAGVVLALVNYYFIHSLLLTLVAAICIASYIPIFSLGLMAFSIRKETD